jgi:hypothetical protein
MRQAGRSLPEYRAVRGEGSILDAIAEPELAAEITLQPVRRYGVDAAVLYSDIVVPVHAIGFGVDVAPGTGPVVAEPFRSAADLDRLRPSSPSDTPYVLETVRILAAELTVPLIGFAGAPFTVASYLVEGRPSRLRARTKALMYGDPGLWHELLDRLADLAIASLRSQVGPAPRPCSCSTRGPATLSRPTTSARPAPQRPGAGGGGRPRRAAHPLRPRHRRAAGRSWRRRRRRGGRRLAHHARRRPHPAPRGRGRAGQPRPVGVPLPLGGGGTQGARDVLASQRRPARPRVQPGPRRAARDRPRHPRAGGRCRAHLDPASSQGAPG